MIVINLLKDFVVLLWLDHLVICYLCNLAIDIVTV